MNEIIAHQFLLEEFFEQVDSIDSIKLVARIFDSRIGHNDSGRIYIFLPDMHIISRKLRQEKYSYGFNHERLYIELLKKLRELKRQQNKYPISVCQLGDFLDLWRDNERDPGDILSDYQGVRDYLYGLGNDWSLNTQFLVGNHDIDIIKVPGLSARWHFRLFFPDQNNPKIYVTHGDVFDLIEKLPDNLQRWAVYLFSPLVTQRPNELTAFMELKRSESLRYNGEQVGQISHLKIMTRDTQIEEQFNITDHKYLEKCYERVNEINQQHGLSMMSAVIGHTHEPKISVIDEANKFFVLMDCGSWQGTYQSNFSSPIANCQIGVICGNDFRVYQLDPDISKSPQFEDVAVL